MIYGTCKGLLASYGVAFSEIVDRILPGAFTNMKIDRDGVPVFWHHEFDEPGKVVGLLNGHWVSSRGLEGELSISDERTYNHIVEKRARALSIGFLFNRRTAKLDENGITLIDSVIELKEVTVLPNGYGADPAARIEQITAPPVRQAQPVMQPHAAAQPAPVSPVPLGTADAFASPATTKAANDLLFMHSAMAAMWKPKPRKVDGGAEYMAAAMRRMNLEAR